MSVTVTVKWLLMPDGVCEFQMLLISWDFHRYVLSVYTERRENKIKLSVRRGNTSFLSEVL